MPNDIPMFEKSGMSIAMGNASKVVQEEANFVTSSNEEEGFAYAMEEFVLG
jgi:hydroxymethylpyrimidine pyrophosphatase-like HAD family hydrolase